MRKWISIAVAVLGVALFMHGSNLARQSTYQEEQAFQTDANDPRRPVLGPVRRHAENASARAQRHIETEVTKTLAATRVSAQWFRGVGAVLFILGIASLLLSARKKEPL